MKDPFYKAICLNAIGSTVASGFVRFNQVLKPIGPVGHTVRIFSSAELDEQGLVIHSTQEIVVSGKESIERLRDLCNDVLNVGNEEDGASQ